MAIISAHEFRDVVIEHVTSLLDSAAKEFNNNNYNIAVFLAISAIEEMANNFYNIIRYDFSNIDFKEYFSKSKELIKKMMETKDKEHFLMIMQEQMDLLNSLFKEGKIKIIDFDVKKLKKIFLSKAHSSHFRKPELGILAALNVNNRARRKLGNFLINKYLELAKQNKISNIRTRALYIGIKGDKLINPRKYIKREMALEIISIAYEVIAEMSDFGAYRTGDDEYSKKASEQLQELWKKADSFYEKYNVKPKVPIGKITNYLNKIGVAIIELNDELNIGDEVIIENHSKSFRQKIESMQIKHQNIEKANSGEKIGLKIKEPIRKKGIIYKIIRK